MHSGQICKCTQGVERKGWPRRLRRGCVPAAGGGCGAWQTAAACTPGAPWLDQRSVGPLAGRRGQEGAQAARVSGASAPPCAHRVLRLLVQRRVTRGCHGAACGGQRPLMEFGALANSSRVPPGSHRARRSGITTWSAVEGRGRAKQSREAPGVNAKGGRRLQASLLAHSAGNQRLERRGRREHPLPATAHRAADRPPQRWRNALGHESLRRRPLLHDRC